MSTIPNTKKNKTFEDRLDLPVSYNKTRLTLMARDPNWMFAYWEIAASASENIKRLLGHDYDRSGMVLRVYDVTYKDFDGGNANHQFDINVGNASNWYVNTWNDSASFCADLGLRAPDGRFFQIARSNFVTTPRKTSSWRKEEVWMKVDEKKAERPYVLARSHANGEKKRDGPSGRYAAARARRISLTEDDVRSYYSHLSPTLKDIISRRIAAEAAMKSKYPGKRYNPDIQLIGSKQDSFLRNTFTKKTMFGSSGEIVSGASESVVGGASESVPKSRKFFFELNTELIVYGRTEPDASVWWEDRPVPLRSDGTFSMRMALPDGRIPLSFQAMSGDKVETREITTGAIREKTRHAQRIS